MADCMMLEPVSFVSANRQDFLHMRRTLMDDWLVVAQCPQRFDVEAHNLPLVEVHVKLVNGRQTTELFGRSFNFRKHGRSSSLLEV